MVRKEITTRIETIMAEIVSMTVEMTEDHSQMKEEESVIMQENRDSKETLVMVIDQMAVIIKALIKVTLIIKMVTGALKITNAVRAEMKDRTPNSSLRKTTRASRTMRQ